MARRGAAAGAMTRVDSRSESRAAKSFATRGVAVFGRLGESPHDHGLERVGHRRVPALRRHGRRAHVVLRHGEGVLAVERQPAGDELVEHDAEAVDVGSRQQRPAHDLFGAHVGAVARRRRVAQVGAALGLQEAGVDHDDGAVTRLDERGRLDRAVHDASGVQGRQAERRLRAQPAHRLRRQGAGLSQLMPQVDAAHGRGRQRHGLVAALPAEHVLVVRPRDRGHAGDGALEHVGGHRADGLDDHLGAVGRDRALGAKGVARRQVADDRVGLLESGHRAGRLVVGRAVTGVTAVLPRRARAA